MIQNICNKLRADVILFNAPIDFSFAEELHIKLSKISKKEQASFVMLTTNGGDAHAAYVIARELQLQYKTVELCIAGDCFSAGTLIVLCAHELIMTDRGRLGPVDVQLRKRDEIMERLSGLTIGAAFKELQSKAGQAVIDIAMDLTMQLKYSRWGHLSFRTALDVAANMVGQMYGEVFKQIDPVRVGEDAMALEIARHYGKMLEKNSANLKQGTVDRLLEDYPSHECIIDRKEAEELFIHVRYPNQQENELLSSFGSLVTSAKEEGNILVFHPCGMGETVSEGERNKDETTNEIKDKSNSGKHSDKAGSSEIVG